MKFNFIKLSALLLALVTAFCSVGCDSGTPTADQTTAAEQTSVVTETEAVTQPPEPLEYDPDDYPAGDVPRVYIQTNAEVSSNVDEDEDDTVNVMLDCAVTSSALESDIYPASYLVDGNLTTRWSSAYDDDAFFVIDTGTQREIGYIGIYWEAAFGAEFSILTSDDGNRWTTRVNEADGHGGWMEYSFDEKFSASYIKFKGGRRGTEYGYSIYEFIAAGSKPNISEYSTDSIKTITRDYSEMTVVIVDKEGGSYETIFDDETLVRIRGNSTAGAPKKPYNIKFPDGISVLGMNRGKKWCLLANMYDKTLMRNKISYDFTGTAGLPAALGTRFCEVYIDGELCGNYIITEPASDGRIKLDIENGEYLLERNGAWAYGSDGYNVSPIYGINFTPDTPDEWELSHEQREEIKSYLTRADEAVSSGDEDAIREILDIDSFVSMYICEELFKDCDIYHGSTYYYIKDGRIYSGPIWDMDLSMGNVSQTNDEDKYRTYNNVSDYHGRSFGDGSDDSASGIWAQIDWYAPLMECAFFYNMVVDKYRRLADDIEEIYRTGGLIDQYLDEFGASFDRNYEECGWSMTTEYSPYERTDPEPDFLDNVEWLRDWLKRRDDWLRVYFRID